MLNISLAIAFLLSDLFSFGGKTAALFIDTAIISGLPQYQQYLFNAFANYWVPTLIIYSILKLTNICNWLNPSKAVHVLIGISNLLLVTYVTARIFASSVEGGSLAVSYFAIFIIYPARILSFVGLILLLSRSISNEDKIGSGDFNEIISKLKVTDYVILIIFISLPTAYFIKQYFGDETHLQKSLGAYQILTEKCSSTFENIYRMPTDINGIYKDYNKVPTRYSKINDGKLLDWDNGRHDGWRLADAGIISFYEIPNYDKYIEKGEYKYRRYVAAERPEKGGYTGKDVDQLMSEYGIFYKKYKTERLNGMYLEGGEYKIFDLRTNELVAETNYYASTKLRRFCGNAPNGEFSGLLFAMRVFSKKL